MTYQDDIPIEAARAAHQWTSHDPQERAACERRDYDSTLANDRAYLEALTDTDEKRATLETEWTRYRAGYRQHYLVMLARKSRCASTMVTGPANFNTRRNDKANQAADRATADLIDYRKRALAAIRRALCPEEAPIMLGNADAGDRIASKLEGLKAERDRMKAANTAIRKHAKAGQEAQVAALGALGLPDGAARDLLRPDFAGRVGYPGYMLTNTGAEIRRLEARATVVEHNQAAPETATEGTQARVVEAPAQNRVFIYFPGKPELAVRDRLKHAGFRWAPTVGAWSAYHNPNAVHVAHAFAGPKAVAPT